MARDLEIGNAEISTSAVASESVVVDRFIVVLL